jgi:hypothetical protein
MWQLFIDVATCGVNQEGVEGIINRRINSYFLVDGDLINQLLADISYSKVTQGDLTIVVAEVIIQNVILM